MFERFSELVAENVPTFFYTDFKGEHLHCCRFDELSSYDIEFAFHAPTASHNLPHKPLHFPVDPTCYRMKFEQVHHHIQRGNTYLLNLTQPTPIETPHTLKEIYDMAHAPYKMRVGDAFVCFSPEPFITIENDMIHTYPMKGTIDAALPDAIETILNDAKETAEHTMIVDLLRNDLGMVADTITVENFRYVTTIDTGEKRLHQVSSHISGKLQENWKKNAGEILKKLLPAGSISGTPKKKTLEIIEEVEGYQRGYFSGVFGYFDGKCLYSAVAIRFIEKSNGKLIYKSGGGITADSDWQMEYHEMIDKIYIP
ncbi:MULTISPECIES: aminodeoxychorismate synthase component I [unclassified Sulfuricurvum]|uniref:aminodeoxychorismate synthase component I n=1 Tax=unclassified Sulfuricurvum TaxID=2632390 RepID=UPI000AA29062|nr:MULTISPECIES: aminodeoxychorismate synthase component I [unclassified Sulfuricurvum]